MAPSSNLRPVSAEMKCPKCEYDNREGVSFCEKCGAELDESQMELRLKCQECGEMNELQGINCTKCGTELEK